MMASAKRKQDEKNLKILRELVSLPGMLRGLTPPHRVKSISMATFTQEEIDFIKERGNEYCRRIWLGLMNPNSPQNLDAKDEQKMKDLMSAKYEFKRYYLDPSMAGKETNSPKQQQTVTSTATTTTTMSTNNVDKRTGGSSSPAGQIGIPRVPVSGSTSMVLSTSSKLKNADLISTNSDFADFSKMRTSDPFVPATTVANQIEPILPQPSFANFDNNPIFDSTKNSSTAFDQISTNFANFNGPNAPSEDRYAALKDLDSLMKQTQLQDDTRTVSAWNTNNANGTHVWSGANNQTTNNVSNPFASTDLWKPSINSVNNNNTPFSSSSSSSIDNAFYNNPANPFKPMQFSTNNDPTWMGGTMSNGDVIPFGQTMTPISNKVWQPAVSPYHANPFMVGSGVTNSTRNSNNPFL